MDRAVAALDERTVADIMTPAPYSVALEHGRLEGIVTTLDVLKTIAAC